MSYTNFNFGINIGGGGRHGHYGHYGHHGHHGMHRMHHGGGWPGGGIPTSLLGYPGSMPYYGGYNDFSSRMIGVPSYQYYNPGFNNGGAVTGATTGAAFGSILGLGLSGGDPGIGLLTTLLGAGLGYSAGGNMGRYGCF